MNNMNSNVETSIKKKSFFRENSWLIIMGLVCFFSGIAFGFMSFTDSKEPVNNKKKTAQTVVLKNRLNVLVLGVDERGDDAGRSDTAFMITVDTQNKLINMLSIPRDSRVKINGHGWDKFNHAYAYGGIALSKATAEALLGIPIDYTVEINIHGFMHMIDVLGGLNIDVEKRMKYSDPYDDDGGLYIDLAAGPQRLDGKTAIQYVRYRDEEGDIGRVGRQQKFLQAVLREVYQPQTVLKIPELAKEFYKTVKTDMPFTDIVALLPLAAEAAHKGMNTEMVQGRPLWLNEISYWFPDIRALRQQIATIQGIRLDAAYMRLTDLAANEYDNSIPRGGWLEEAPAALRTADSRGARTSSKDPAAPVKAAAGDKELSSSSTAKTPAAKLPATETQKASDTTKSISKDEKPLLVEKEQPTATVKTN